MKFTVRWVMLTIMQAYKSLIVFLLLIVLSACAPKVYEPIPVREIDLPRDDANHLAPIEWWYYTGHFFDQDNNRYGFELTFFKTYTPRSIKLFSAIPAYYILDKFHVAHFAITDINNQKFEKAEKTDIFFYDAQTSATELNVSLSNWYAKRAADGISHEIYANIGSKAIHFTLSPEKPAAKHGNPPGIQSMGEAGVSYYISYTRMRLSGELLTDCVLNICNSQRVSGQAWHDHQWGNFNLYKFAGWDWFSLQFDDDSEVMLYLIRQASGEYSEMAGSYIAKDGNLRLISKDDISLSVTNTWASPETGAIYPIEWSLKIPKLNLDISISPALLNQEMDTRASTGIVYWEGAVDVSGSKTGLGYVELTNYDLYPYGKTDDNSKLKSNALAESLK